VTRDAQRVAELASAIDADPAVLHALTPLIGRPLLQAWRRRWADRVPADWRAGYCPICGGWPVLAEVRGLEGSRRLRCGDCGGDWPGRWLCCPFCGERDDQRLGSLVSAENVERHSVEVCDGCGGYIKSVTSLTPMSADDVVLHHLTSLELDVAAMDRGYRRPSGKGHEVVVNVVPRASLLRELFGWQ
jgi:FdhE protein